MQPIFDVLKTFTMRTWVRLGLAFGFILLPVFLFVELAEEVGDQETLGYDEAILRWINTFSSPALDPFVIGLTQLGGFVGVASLTTVMMILLIARHMRRMALILACGVGGAGVINLLLKAVFQRDRPELWERIVTENSYSFPSGHAMASSALAFSLMVVFWPTRWRWVVVVVATVFLIVIGFTRLYLGVHYPTDVVAGWSVSAAWVAAVSLTTLYWQRTRRTLGVSPRL